MTRTIIGSVLTGAAVAVGYVALMNYLGGEKYLLGNRIRETIKCLKQARKK